MRGSKILRKLVFPLTLRGSYCSRLFEQYLIETFVSQLSDKTRIPRLDSPQDLPFRYHQTLNPKSSHLLSEPSSESTSPTSDTHFLVTVISVDGLHKVSFFGTRSRLLDQISLFLATGKSGVFSTERS